MAKFQMNWIVIAFVVVLSNYVLSNEQTGKDKQDGWQHTSRKHFVVDKGDIYISLHLQLHVIMYTFSGN